MNISYIHDDYKLAMDQWQRLTHAVRMGNREDCLDALSQLEAKIFAMKSSLRMHKFIAGLDEKTKQKLWEK